MLQPITNADWSLEKAAHLLNRTGFGARLPDIEWAGNVTPQKAVEHLLDFSSSKKSTPPPDWVHDVPRRRLVTDDMQNMSDEMMQDMKRERGKERRKLSRAQLVELRQWWLGRMHDDPCPLREKLTLFWHGHFATAFKKVKSAHAMYQQNDTLRRHAAGDFQKLVTAVAQDPAMLLYLDNAKNRRRAPNENFARELMELFTLGEGEYTEKDIKEAARAFTGWSLNRDRMKFVVRDRMHDDRAKTVMGSTGRFDGHDIIQLLLDRPEAATHLAKKLWSYFAHAEPTPNLIRALATELRNENFRIRPVLHTMLLSKAFYSANAMRTQIKSPVHWLIGSLRALDEDLRSPRAVQRGLRLLGQDLFDPPNVKGWDGGYTWVSTGTLLLRYQFAEAICKGVMGRRAWLRVSKGFEPEKVLPPKHRKSRSATLSYLKWRLFQSPLTADEDALFGTHLDSLPPPAKWSDERVRDVVTYMMCTPQYQLT